MIRYKMRSNLPLLHVERSIGVTTTANRPARDVSGTKRISAQSQSRQNHEVVVVAIPSVTASAEIQGLSLSALISILPVDNQRPDHFIPFTKAGHKAA